MRELSGMLNNIPLDNPPGEGYDIDMQTYIKKTALKRLKTIRGHLTHVIKMVEENKYCIDILQQSSALQSALSSFDSVVLKGHLEECVTNAMQKRGREQEKSIKEIVDVFKKRRS